MEVELARASEIARVRGVGSGDDVELVRDVDADQFEDGRVVVDDEDGRLRRLAFRRFDRSTPLGRLLDARLPLARLARLWPGTVPASCRAINQSLCDPSPGVSADRDGGEAACPHRRPI